MRLVLATKREVDMSERKLLFMMKPEQLEAFLRLQQAAERGDGDAACRLGDMYREGLGGLRFSPKQTYRWYAKSALAGDANGQNNLGACYEHGLGCVQSYAKAVKWYRLAAAQGLAYASSNLGYCHFRGHGVGMDLGAALAWFERALEQGDDRAKEMVERLERDLGVVLSTGMSRGPQPASVAACPGGHAVNPATLRSRLRCGPADSSLSRRSSRRDSPLEARSRLLPRDGPPGQLRHLHVAPVGSTSGRYGRDPPTLEHPADPSVESGQPRSAAQDGRRRIRFVDKTVLGKNFGIVGIGGVARPDGDASGSGDSEERQ
jgi:hypothetical protein